MITARELVFYIRAEDQASRVVKRVAGSFGSLSKIKSLQAAASQQNTRNYLNEAKAQQQVRRNAEAIERANVAASKSARALSVAQRTGTTLTGTTVAEAFTIHQADLERLATLNREQELLGTNLDEVRRTGAAASAAIDKQITQAQIARAESYVGALQNIGRAMRLVGVIAGASLAFAAHQAANFETQLTLAASQARPAGAGAGATLEIAQRLQGVVLKQMQQFPATSQQMADSLYQIFSSTNIQNIKQASDLLSTFNKAAVAGGVDLGSMSDAGITLQNNFVGAGKEFKNINEALNVFFSAVRYGRMSATQFAGSLSNVVSSGVAAGQTFKDISDAMAALTRQTGAARTSRDATGLARLFEMLIRPDVVAGLKKIGVNEIDPVTNKLKPLLQVITDIQQKANLKGVNAVNFFKTISALGSGGAGTAGTIQGRRAFQYLIQDIKNYHSVSKDVNSDNTEFVRSYQALSKSPGVRWQILVNQFKALAIVIGTQAIPAFVRMGQPLVRLLAWFNGLSEHTKHLIGEIGTFGSAALIVVGTLVVMGGAVGKLYLTLKLLNLSRLATDAGEVSTKFGLFAGAAAGLLILLIKYPHVITGIVNALGGFKNILLIIGNIGLAFTLAKVVGSLSGVMTQAGLAEDSVLALRGGLLKLSLIGAITIPIILDYQKKFEKDTRNKKGVGGFIANTIGGIPIIGPVAEAGGEAGRRTMDALGLSDRARAQARVKAQAAAAKEFSSEWSKTEELQAILTNKTVSNFQKGVARSAFNSKDYNELNKVYAQMMVPIVKAQKEAVAKTKSIQNAISAASKDAAWQKLFNQVITLDKIKQADPTLKNITAVLDAEDKLQKASTGNQYQAAQEYLSQLESTWNTAEKTVAKHAKNIAKIEKDNVKNAKTAIDSLTQGVQSMYNNLLQQNQTLYGTLFQGPVVTGARVQNNLQFGGHVTGINLLQDLKAQNFQFARVNRDLNSLTRRGAPKALLDQIRAAGPDAIPDIKALMGLTPAQFKEYIRAFNSGQSAIKRNTMTQLNSQLKLYESFGKKVAQAIIKGVSSEDPKLQTTLENSVLKMFPGLASQARLSGGVKPPTSTAPKTTHKAEEHTHYHITAPNSDLHGTITAIKHADFKKRSKYKGNT